MKSKAGIIILIVLSVALAMTLLVRSKQATDQKKTDAEIILNYSNKWVITSEQLGDQAQVNVQLEKKLNERNTEIEKLTNDLTQTVATLAQFTNDLETARKEIAEREAKIADLEAQNQNLDKQALELSTAITNLNTQIDDTHKKLAAAEGDKVFLESELKRLMAEKAELEQKFNDLEMLRAQVRKLRDELSIAKRLDWIRKGLFADTEMKGAQKLVEGIKSPSAEAEKGPHYDLNVEIGSDGSIRIIPPLTNRPAMTNPPPAP